MLFSNKTQFTSDPVQLQYQPLVDAYIKINGPGPVELQLLEEGSAAAPIWRSYPELTFTGPTAQIATLPRGQFRVVVNAQAATTVEIRL